MTGGGTEYLKRFTARIYFINLANYSLSNSSFKKLENKRQQEQTALPAGTVGKFTFSSLPAPAPHTSLASVPLHRCTPHPN